MLQIFLDTETTDLDPTRSRIIEIACVVAESRQLTTRLFHHYLQPGCALDPNAVAVHGITEDFLKDKPTFSDIAVSFLEFVEGAELIMHNAPFDVGFLEAELHRWGWSGSLADHCQITDSLVLARKKHPGQRNSLSHLCKRYRVDDSERTRHGALLDARLLAKVYFAMTGGQIGLHWDMCQGDDSAEASHTALAHAQRTAGVPRATHRVQPSAEEMAAHRDNLKHLAQLSEDKQVRWETVITAQ